MSRLYGICKAQSHEDVVKFIILTNLVRRVILWSMEKRKPYNLEEVKAVVRDPNFYPFTASARRGGNALGLKPQEMREVVLSLSLSDFFKSMTRPAITEFGKMYIMARLHQTIPYISRSQVTLMVDLLLFHLRQHEVELCNVRHAAILRWKKKTKMRHFLTAVNQ